MAELTFEERVRYYENGLKNVSQRCIEKGENGFDENYIKNEAINLAKGKYSFLKEKVERLATEATKI